MVHIQIYGYIPFFCILGKGLFQCPLINAFFYNPMIKTLKIQEHYWQK